MKKLLGFSLIPLLSVGFTGNAPATDHYQQAQQSATEATWNFLNANPEWYPKLLPPQGTGLYTAPMIEYQADGEILQTLLNPARATLIDFGNSLLAWRDRDNLLQIYTLVYEVLPPIMQQKWPSPQFAQTLTPRKLHGLVKQQRQFLSDNLGSVLNHLPPTILAALNANPIGDCIQEVGYEDAGTSGENPARCDIANYAPVGLMANVDFPLKDNLTCVKDQGRRGTCVAHAIAAVVETLIMVETAVAENLSEQDLYYEGEIEVDDPWDRYIDGLPTTSVLEHLDTTDYQLQFESSWNYNRSLNRSAMGIDSVNGVPFYPNSCTSPYLGEMCSDYAYQGVTTFPQILTGVPTRPALPAIGASQVTSVSVLPVDAVDLWRPSLDTAIVLLAADMPVILSASVTQEGFQQPDANGYVTYAPNQTVVGSHAMLVVGFVANDDLPAGAPPATDQGYFIIKNSWGTGAADCGFLYLDYAYLFNHANSIMIVDAP